MLQTSSCFTCLCAGLCVWSSAFCWLCHLQPAHPPEELCLCCHGSLSTAFLAPPSLCVSVTSLAPSCLCCSMKSWEKELQRVSGLLWWQSCHQQNTGFFFLFSSSVMERALRHLTLPQLQGRTHDVTGLATFVLVLIWTATLYLDWFLSLGKKM